MSHSLYRLCNCLVSWGAEEIKQIEAVLVVVDNPRDSDLSSLLTATELGTAGVGRPRASCSQYGRIPRAALASCTRRPLLLYMAARLAAILSLLLLFLLPPFSPSSPPAPASLQVCGADFIKIQLQREKFRANLSSVQRGLFCHTWLLKLGPCLNNKPIGLH